MGYFKGNEDILGVSVLFVTGRDELSLFWGFWRFLLLMQYFDDYLTISLSFFFSDCYTATRTMPTPFLQKTSSV